MVLAHLMQQVALEALEVAVLVAATEELLGQLTLAVVEVEGVLVMLFNRLVAMVVQE
jgi:hypothetical protein